MPTTAKIALMVIVLSLASNGALLGFIKFATLDEHVGLAETIEGSLLLALLLSLLFGTVSGLLIARFVARRVAEVAGVADAVGDGDLTRRAPVHPGNDAFDYLAARLNSMLDRIERLMRELRLLTDGLAHDLRSPIGRLRARVERLQTEFDEGQRDHQLAGVLVEADALSRILDTVLEIGRSESMAARAQFAPVDLDALVLEVGEMYEPLAEERGIRLVTTADGGGTPIKGHRQLLAQALSNLVDNALKYGNREIELSSRHGAGQVSIGVRDRGPGIAEGDLAQARQRFGRLDPSRHIPGAGLGLSLVEAVAHLHDGRLTLDNARPGLDARIVLPATPVHLAHMKGSR